MSRAVMANFPFARVGVALVFVAASGLAQAAAVSPQDKTRTVWDGVYTDQQAARGREGYETSCSSCHQPGLTGGGESPALVGNPFMERWREDNLATIVTRVSTLMPFDNPATLSRDAYLDIIAYILQVNGFPAGTEALSPDGLADIRIVGKEGAGPVPNFALVQVVGCLTRGANNTWRLMNGTEPVRTSSPKASAGTELEGLNAAPLGEETYVLLSVYPSPEAHNRHKMEAKGFLVRMNDETRINVSALQMISERCE